MESDEVAEVGKGKITQGFVAPPAWRSNRPEFLSLLLITV